MNIPAEARKRASHKDLQKLASVRESSSLTEIEFKHWHSSSAQTSGIKAHPGKYLADRLLFIWNFDLTSSKLSETILKTGDSLTWGFQKVLLESFCALEILNLKPAERGARRSQTKSFPSTIRHSKSPTSYNNDRCLNEYIKYQGSKHHPRWIRATTTRMSLVPLIIVSQATETDTSDDNEHEKYPVCAIRSPASL